MRCTCGNDNPANARFCSKCGKPIESRPEEKTVMGEDGYGGAQTMNEIETTNGPVGTSAPGNGTNTNGYQGNNNGATKTPKKKSKAGIVLVLIAIFAVIMLLVLVVIGGGLGFFFIIRPKMNHKQAVSVSVENYADTSNAEITIEEIFETVPDDIASVEAWDDSNTDNTTTTVSVSEVASIEAPEPEPEPEPIPEPEPVSPAESEYMCPNSDTIPLTEADLEGFDKWDCIYARNEIYARHGRKFKNDQVREYFESKSWYNGTIDPDSFSDSVFSKVELENIAFIVSYEKKKGYK